MQALAGGADSSDDEDGLSGAGRSPTYVQEQEALRRGFMEVRPWSQNCDLQGRWCTYALYHLLLSAALPEVHGLDDAVRALL